MIKAGKPLELQSDQSWKAIGAATGAIEAYRMVRAGKPMEPQNDQGWKATEAADQICKTIGATG